MQQFQPSDFSFEEKPMDSDRLLQSVNILAGRYPFLRTVPLTKSILGKEIPVLLLGTGRRHIFYIGAHHGMEWMTSVLLLKWVDEFCRLYANGAAVFKVSLPFLWEEYTVHVIPMLNPDGVDYQIHGVSPDHPIYSRLLAMNGGSADFSHWQANARGVDLNHNYDFGFSAYQKLEKDLNIVNGAASGYSGCGPESEPEVRALCSRIRFFHPVQLVLTLHTQGEVIYCRRDSGTLPKNRYAAERLARLCQYQVETPTGTAAFGGLTDWCIEKLSIPALTFECGKGTNPLPLSDFPAIYARLKPIFFKAPLLY